MAQMRSRRLGLAVAAAVLCVGVVVLQQVERNADMAGEGIPRIELAEVPESANSSSATAGPTVLSWFGQVMQHISGGLGNLTKSNSTSCEDGDSCGEIRRLGSPVQIVDHLSDNWLFRNPHDHEPHAFCGTFRDLSDSELRMCIDHFVAKLMIVRQGLRLPENSRTGNDHVNEDWDNTTDVNPGSGYPARLRHCYNAGHSEQV